jgi:hemolysin activation/secretion protein
VKKSTLLLLGLALLSSSAQLSAADTTPAFSLAAQRDEPVILASLKSVVLLPDAPAENAPAALAQAAIDASRVPWLQNEALTREVAPFLGHPVSVASLGRLQMVIRIHLQLLGRPFARVFAPPQDITDGTVRIVVQPATLDGDVRLDGNQWFARERYTGALRVRSGEALDAATLNADLAWLNRNPFSRVTPVLEAGEQPGTTRVTLRAEERFPFSFAAGYDNTGTPNTDEERVSASMQWGNAFGRGDLASYRFAGDPSFAHMRSHSGGYTAFLPWRHVLSLQAAYSEIESVMPEPFTQGGTSWQVGARYEIPLAAPRAGWTQSLNLTADFKSSDNTLEFAEIPITGNTTHVAQFGGSYGLTFPALGGQNDARLELQLSPGNLTRYNDTAAFDGSRPGAKAAYGYAKLGLRHQHGLTGGWGLILSADAQFSTGALLGSEQLNGGGVSAVRGYRENSAFGDWGVLGTAELHAPGFAVLKGRDRADVFAFIDAASLRLHVDQDGTDLASAGVGVNYQFGAHFSLRASYGWQLQPIDSSRGDYSGHGHVSANVSW